MKLKTMVISEGKAKVYHLYCMYYHTIGLHTYITYYLLSAMVRMSYIIIYIAHIG